MVALMKFTRDICRLLGLGSGPPVQQQQEMDCGAATHKPVHDATLSQDTLNGEEGLSEEEKVKRRAERRRAKRKRRRARKKQEQVKQSGNADQDQSRDQPSCLEKSDHQRPLLVNISAKLQSQPSLASRGACSPSLRSGKNMAALSAQWTEEKELQLITFYSENDALWNHKAKVYQRRDLRARALECIRGKLSEQQLVPFTVGDITNKFKNLRTVFQREHKAVANSMKSGAGAEEVYIPKWKFYKHCLFLSGVGEPDKSSDNLEILPSPASNENQPHSPAAPSPPIPLSPSLDPMPSTSNSATQQPSEKRKRPPKERALEAMDFAMDFLKKPTVSKHAGFFKYVEEYFNDMPDDKVKMIKRKMIETLHKCSEE